MDKLDEYNDIVSRLVSETVSCCPETWDRGILTIQSDGIRLTYQLKNADHPEKASISKHLRDLIDEFYVRMARRDEAWSESTVTWHRNGDDCKFKIDYAYPERNKAPWWNIFAKRA